MKQNHPFIQKIEGQSPTLLHAPNTSPDFPAPCIRIGAYCRVSTDHEAQQSSLELQITAFRTQIAQHPHWQLVDIYADDGLSGGNVRRRKAFNRMIQDSQAGKLDYIITKSISRFARNTLECLTYVRQLQKYGTQIYFEKENIDTGSTFSEMLLTILAAFAQEESRSLSENTKWGIRKRFEAGQEKRVRVFGYRFDANHHYIIEPGEAQTIRRIFDLYETGQYSMKAIARKLMEEHRPSANGDRWSASHVHVILNNEKYIGDVLMQKKYTIDHMTHREVKNHNCALPQFYVKKHHIPIIDRTQFERCRKIARMKNIHGQLNQYPYGPLLFCPCCQRPMKKCHGSNASAKSVWRCHCSEGQWLSIPQAAIDRAMLAAYRQLNIAQIEAMHFQNPALDVQTLLSMKHQCPAFCRVDFYWLDILIDRLTIENDNVLIIEWKCGLRTHQAL